MTRRAFLQAAVAVAVVAIVNPTSVLAPEGETEEEPPP
jgi:hypothetical protein